MRTIASSAQASLPPVDSSVGRNRAIQPSAARPAKTKSRKPTQQSRKIGDSTWRNATGGLERSVGPQNHLTCAEVADGTSTMPAVAMQAIERGGPRPLEWWFMAAFPTILAAAYRSSVDNLDTLAVDRCRWHGQSLRQGTASPTRSFTRDARRERHEVERACRSEGPVMRRPHVYGAIRDSGGT